MAATIQGGEWIIKEVKSEDVFIPEEFNEEQLMVRDMYKCSHIQPLFRCSTLKLLTKKLFI